MKDSKIFHSNSIYITGSNVYVQYICQFLPYYCSPSPVVSIQCMLLIEVSSFHRSSYSLFTWASTTSSFSFSWGFPFEHLLWSSFIWHLRSFQFGRWPFLGHSYNFSCIHLFSSLPLMFWHYFLSSPSQLPPVFSLVLHSVFTPQNHAKKPIEPLFVSFLFHFCLKYFGRI